MYMRHIPSMLMSLVFSIVAVATPATPQPMMPHRWTSPSERGYHQRLCKLMSPTPNARRVKRCPLAGGNAMQISPGVGALVSAQASYGGPLPFECHGLGWKERATWVCTHGKLREAGGLNSARSERRPRLRPSGRAGEGGGCWPPAARM